MAKIGFLYLHKGVWENQQIISSDWVEESTRKHVAARGFPGYGYQWWTADTGSFIAVGYGGQYIYVIPDKNLIAVFTSSLKIEDMTIPTGMLYSNIIPAIKSDKALPDPFEYLEVFTETLPLWLSTPEALAGEEIPKEHFDYLFINIVTA